MMARNRTWSGRGGRWSGWAILRRFLRSHHLRWSTVSRAVPWEVAFGLAEVMAVGLGGSDRWGGGRGSTHLVLAVVGNDDADEEGHAHHATEKDKDVYVKRVELFAAARLVSHSDPIRTTTKKTPEDTHRVVEALQQRLPDVDPALEGENLKEGQHGTCDVVEGEPVRIGPVIAKVGGGG